MTETAPIRKTISHTYFRHQPSLIPSNPDAPPPDVYLLEYQIPKWCQTALTQTPDSRSPAKRQSNANAFTALPTPISSQNKTRVHACRALLKTAEERPDLRRALILSRGLIETIVLILDEDDSGSHQHVVRRCQELLLTLLSLILLTDPQLDQYIIFEPGMVDAIAKMLLNGDKDVQTVVATVFNYACVVEENRSLICGTDHVLFGLVQLLHNTKSLDAREHALQGLLYLSEIPENRFMIARQSGMLEALTICLFYQQISIPTKVLQILQNLLLLKENIPLVAKQQELCERIQAVYKNAKAILKRNNQLESDDMDDCEEVEIQNYIPAPAQFDTVSKEEGESTLFRYEKLIVRICTIVLQLVFKFDTRLNSKLILQGNDYNSQDRIIISTPSGNFVSTSILERLKQRSLGNGSINDSREDF